MLDLVSRRPERSGAPSLATGRNALPENYSDITSRPRVSIWSLFRDVSFSMRHLPVSSGSLMASSSAPSVLHVPVPDPSLAARAALALIRAYKLVLSPWFTGACRFVPTCGDYAAEAIARHGFLYGTWLAARRLSKCHPVGASGYDPVPSRPVGLCGRIGLVQTHSPANETTASSTRSTCPSCLD
jgi:putative membrane protein insertion efficiency factor